jgi:polyisoprenoid-binding protein YceI
MEIVKIMKKLKLFTLAVCASIAFLSCKQAPEGDKAKTSEAQEVTEVTGDKTRQIDVTKSSLAWIGTKVTKHHAGTVNIKSGELITKGQELTGGSFSIDMPTLVSTSDDEKTNTNLTGHLLSPDFFDVAKFPEAKFTITAVKPFSGSSVTDVEDNELNSYKVADPNVTISGNLTIKEITKNIEFPAKVSIVDNSATAMAKFVIDRREWGITYPGMPDDLIKDEIWFGVNLLSN